MSTRHIKKFSNFTPSNDQNADKLLSEDEEELPDSRRKSAFLSAQLLNSSSSEEESDDSVTQTDGIRNSNVSGTDQKLLLMSEDLQPSKKSTDQKLLLMSEDLQPSKKSTPKATKTAPPLAVTEWDVLDSLQRSHRETCDSSTSDVILAERYKRCFEVDSQNLDVDSISRKRRAFFQQERIGNIQRPNPAAIRRPFKTAYVRRRYLFGEPREDWVRPPAFIAGGMTISKVAPLLRMVLV
jgi:hypothetical protein